MHLKTLLLTTGLLWYCVSTAGAQSLSSAVPSLAVALSGSDEGADDIAADALYSDRENELLFIDFEQLSVNLKNVVLRNQEGQILFEEEVINLPVDAIYELDLSAYLPGTYRLELHGYTGVIRRAIQVE